MRMLQRGSTGPDVKDLQENLNRITRADLSHGPPPPPLVPDGKFGGMTDGAVRNFQHSANLKPDGIVGNNTRNAMNARLAQLGHVVRTSPIQPAPQQQSAGETVIAVQADQMGYPLELDFGAGCSSMGSVNSLLMAAGSITLPITPLDFSYDNKLTYGQKFADAHADDSNEHFYKNFYSNLPSGECGRFRGTRRSLSRQIGGVSIPIGGGSILKAAGEAIEAAVANRIARKILGNIGGFDAAQATQSANALIRAAAGSGRTHYNWRPNEFDNSRIALLQIGGGAFVGVNLNLVLFSDRPFARISMAALGAILASGPLAPTGLATLFIQRLSTYLAQAKGYALVSEAVAGPFMLPGGSVGFLTDG